MLLVLLMFVLIFVLEIVFEGVPVAPTAFPAFFFSADPTLPVPGPVPPATAAVVEENEATVVVVSAPTEVKPALVVLTGPATTPSA